MVVLLLSCAQEVEVTPGWQPEPQMSSIDLLIRASLDVRGVRPSVDELEQVEADPDSVDALVATFVDDDRFGDRVRDLWSEVLLTRADQFTVSEESFDVDDGAGFRHAVGEEGLHILARVATEDRPWSEVVTADWTMANAMLEDIWPLERADGDGWVEATYTDGRPHAGVLTTNSLMWRYTSTPSNGNRKRANAVSTIFLCNDYLSRPIDFDRNVNLLDEGAVADALRNDPSCVNCHNSLDPIASSMFGFFTYDPGVAAEITTYHPERELLWRDYIGIEPAWYGQPVYTMQDLGAQIAGDPRFVECAVERTWEMLLRRDASIDDTDALTRHREAFVISDLSYKELVRSVLTDSRYRAGDTDRDGWVPTKMATPDLLASQVQDLTGFSWTWGGYDMLRSDGVGVRLLAGGSDGNTVTQTATSPNTTLIVVQERLAQAAAWHVVENEPERLFTVDFTETLDTDRDAMVAQIQDLHWRIFGNRVAADGPEVEANLQLWTELYAIERDGVDAWAGVLSVLLRDPDFLLY